MKVLFKRNNELIIYKAEEVTLKEAEEFYKKGFIMEVKSR